MIHNPFLLRILWCVFWLCTVAAVIGTVITLTGLYNWWCSGSYYRQLYSKDIAVWGGWSTFLWTAIIISDMYLI